MKKRIRKGGKIARFLHQALSFFNKEERPDYKGFGLEVEEGHIFTLSEAANVLNIAYSTLYLMVSKGALKAKMFGNVYVIQEKDLVKFRKKYYYLCGKPRAPQIQIP
jgi:excisionase family DNA binding protein